MATNRAVVAALLIAASCGCAAAAKENVETTLGTDQFAAGGSVTRTGTVAGDLIAAGGEVEVDAQVQGDAVVAGGNVRIAGSVGQSVYAAGGRVHLDAQVSRNVRLAGGRVEIGPSAEVKGNATLGGGQVSVHGSVKGYLQAAGGHVFIDGPVEGDVVANAGRVELGPRAKIAGSFRYRSREALVRDPGAQVSGPLERLSASAGPGVTVSTSRTHWAGSWLWSAGLLMLAALLAAAVPPASMRVSGELRSHPGLALLFGFIALVCIPIAVIVLLVTIIGIPIALMVLLAYLLLLLLGYVSAAVGMGEAALATWRPADAARSSWRVLAAVVAMLVLSLVARIPYLGGLVVFFAMLVGIGAILMALRPGKAPDPVIAKAPAA